MKITLAQINPIVGDLKGNLQKMKTAYGQAVQEKSDLVIFPELSITGYPPLDLLEKQDFILETIKTAKDFASSLNKNTASIFGFVDINRSGKGKKLLNAAAFASDGKILSVTGKTLLPTYDIFDEERYFEPSKKNELVKFKGINLAITVCEDIWAETKLLPDEKLYKKNPLKELLAEKPDIIINISASPFYKHKNRIRTSIIRELSAKIKKPIVYVNCVGANDELIFDGRSFVSTEKGELALELAGFEEEIKSIDLSQIKKSVKQKPSDTYQDIRRALSLGISDYFHKQGFHKAVIGLSGGIDSAVTAALAVDALGAQNILGVMMPSDYTSQRSIQDALKLAKNLNIRTERRSISGIFQAYAKELSLSVTATDLTMQNLQSRIRGNILMAYSNKQGYLVLTTGNKSEISMGYSTLYGDTAGAIAPIGDLLKNEVYGLAKFLNKDKEVIPLSTINRPPTAELKPNQKDSDDLPPYNFLDKAVSLYIEKNQPLSKIFKTLKNRALILNVLRRIELNEYKRKQLPMCLKISEKSFGMGRKMPNCKKTDFLR